MDTRKGLPGIALAAALALSPAAAQQTVGLFVEEPGSFGGYTLYSTLGQMDTYLIDKHGKLVHQWTSAYPTGNGIYLLPDGHLLRCGRYEPEPIGTLDRGGAGGRIEEFDWDGNLVWDFIYASDTYRHHHDLARLPNGNVLLISWELKTMAEAIAAGRDPALLPNGELWPEKIVEVQPTGPTSGTIVWEWHVWDHLIQDFDPTKDNFGVVGDHPELVDVNFTNGSPGPADWLHANSIDYNPELDQIVLSVPTLDEIWIIDHSTTTAEAAGHTGGNSGMGGDLLYRWGNPQAYRRGTDADRTLFSQHDAEWIPPGHPGAGHILVFNNGQNRPAPQYSSVDELIPPLEEDGTYTLPPGGMYGPAAPAWSYVSDPPTDFYSYFISGSQRLPNGNTLITAGATGDLFEVTAAGQVVWRYVNPMSGAGPIVQGTAPAGNRVFRADRYAANGPELAGKVLTAGDPLEVFTAPLPVPDGRSGTTPVIATRLDDTGSALRVTWDTASCVSGEYNLLWGDLADVAAQNPTGSECAIGTAGSHDWLTVPPGDLYFLVVGVDAMGIYESSWGETGAGSERHGASASFECSATSKVMSESCP